MNSIKGEGESNGFDSPSHVCACIDQLEQAGFEAWAVGGCVRDLLRGVQPHDYDLTTSALPEETLRLFPHTVPTGITYGTVTVIAQREPLEVTTFRTEEAYHDFRGLSVLLRRGLSRPGTPGFYSERNGLCSVQRSHRSVWRAA